MGFRITTWNVNGIRNPFSYEPWRGTRTFESMFDTLEADIVVLQETKIQRKDLRDDMVLVPGWDCYFSLPRVKKGYSGVVIYTRNATCSPIRAEEGITGVLCPPNSSVSFCDLPKDQHIGGYPTADQLSRPTVTPEVLDSEEEQDNVRPKPDAKVDAPTLDSEGRCVVLEFPAFVLIGVYCPAYRDESRDSFRMDFLNALDSRVRNLTEMGKRVIVTGDINIAKHTIDSAHGMELIRKSTTSEEEFISGPARRLFNQLVSDGVVIGEREEGRETPVLLDVCRSFHPERTGMYTCWDQKLNARPGNYGSRIDYVLCSLDMQDWFADSNIQEGLMGSDHCPVYAILKEHVNHLGDQINIRDLLNPPGMFKDGKRQKEYSKNYVLPASGRLLPEFDLDKRRNIKEMFARKPKSISSNSEDAVSTPAATPGSQTMENGPVAQDSGSGKSRTTVAAYTTDNIHTSQTTPRKRPQPSFTAFTKRSKSGPVTSSGTSTGNQKTLKGFFKPKITNDDQALHHSMALPIPDASSLIFQTSKPSQEDEVASAIDPQTPQEDTIPTAREGQACTQSTRADNLNDDDFIVDPIVSKEDWSKLFTKKPAPQCDGHKEPCISLTTKKPGMNRGRLFWICSRPLGPNGEKEKGTRWRCPTFIWASDWNSSAGSQE